MRVYLRTAALAMYVFLTVSLIPFVPFVSPAFMIVFVVVVLLLVRWQIKFGGLISSDSDYQAARRSWRTSLVMMIVALPLGFVVRPIVQAVLFRFAAGE